MSVAIQAATRTARPAPRALHAVAGIEAVQAELGDVLDPAELAQWLTEPNSSLCGCSPADMLAFDPRAVLHAARLDRFIFKG